MSQRTIILALCGLVLLLAGTIIGQNLERYRSDGVPPAYRLPADGAADVTGPRAAPQASLSRTEYWVSGPEMDVTRTGFAAWAVLRPGGNFILERCLAPDYRIPDKPGTRLTSPVPRCETIADGTISRLGDDQLAVRSSDGPPRTFRFSLARRGTIENLLLDVGKTVKLLPGSKDSLFQRLQTLPADAEARNRYMQRLFAGGLARVPGAQPIPGRPVQ